MDLTVNGNVTLWKKVEVDLGVLWGCIYCAFTTVSTSGAVTRYLSVVTFCSGDTIIQIKSKAVLSPALRKRLVEGLGIILFL